MKYEKTIVALTVFSLIFVTTHESVAATSNSSSKISKRKLQNEIAAVEKDLNLKPKAKSKSTIINVNNNKKTRMSKKRTVKNDDVIARSSSKQVSQKRTIKKSTNKGFVAAVKNPVRSESVMKDLTNNQSSLSSSRIKTETIKSDASKSAFSGSVEFVYGHDNNLGDDKYRLKDDFFKISPTIGYQGDIFASSFGASIQSFTEDEYSNNYKKDTAFADLSFSAKVSDSIKSKTTLGAKYVDAREPDYINNGDFLVDGENPGSPVRYSELSIAQAFIMDTGSLVSEIGGQAMSRNSSTLTTDNADDVLNLRTVDGTFATYEKDYSVLSAYGKLTFKTTSFLDISAKPSVSQLRYKSGTRYGRCPDGGAAGTTQCVGLSDTYEHITSDLKLETAFKFGDSHITPNASVGIVSDEALGAEDQSFYTLGISSSLMLHKDLGLALTPSYSYTKINYDNYTRGIENGETRKDDQTSLGVDAKINVAKNVSVGTGYTIIRQESNKSADRSVNYRQEIFNTGLTFNF